MRTQSYIGQADLEYKMRVDSSLLKWFNFLIALLSLALVLVPITLVGSTPLAIPSIFEVSFWTTLLSAFDFRNLLLIVMGLVMVSFPIMAILWLIIPADDLDSYRNRVAKTNMIYLAIFVVFYAAFYAFGWITLSEGLMVPINYAWFPLNLAAFPNLFLSMMGWIVIASVGNASIGEGNPDNRRVILFQALSLLVSLGVMVTLFIPYYTRQDTIPIYGYDLFSIPGLIYPPALEAMLTYNQANFPMIVPLGVALLNIIVLLIVANVLSNFLTLVFNKPKKWLAILINSLLLLVGLVSVYFTFTYFEVWPSNPMNYIGVILVIVGSIGGILLAVFGIKEMDHDHYPFLIAGPKELVEHPIEAADMTAAPLPVPGTEKATAPATPVTKKVWQKQPIVIIELLLSVVFIALFFVDFYTRLGVGLKLLDVVVFGTPTNATVVQMFNLNASNWFLSSIVPFATFAQYTLLVLVVLFVLNLILRIVTLIVRKPLRMVSMVLSITMLVVALVTFYLTFTFFEIYWNAPLTYLGVIIFFVIAVIHLVFSMVLKPARAVAKDEPVVSAIEEPVTPQDSMPISARPKAAPVSNGNSATRLEAISLDEEVPAEEEAPVPLPTVELETINVFEMPSSVPVRTTPRQAPKPATQPQSEPVVSQPVPQVEPTPQPQRIAEPQPEIYDEPIAEPIRVAPKPKARPVSDDGDEDDGKPITFTRKGSSDTLFDELGSDEQEEFRRFYIDPGVDHKVPYLQYVIGGDNSQFFSNVFYYMSRYRKVISISMLTKIYEHIKVMLGDDNSEISHLNTQLIRIYFSRRNEPGVMKLLIAKCKEDIELNLNVLKVRDMYLYSFKRLVMVHEAMGNYTEAKRWVELALELNLDDKTKGGYPARLQRINAKIQLYTDN